MIILSEQYGYNKPRSIEDIDRFAVVLNNQSYNKSIQRGDNKAYCYNIIHSENEQNPYR